MNPLDEDERLLEMDNDVRPGAFSSPPTLRQSETAPALEISLNLENIQSNSSVFKSHNAIENDDDDVELSGSIQSASSSKPLLYLDEHFPTLRSDLAGGIASIKFFLQNPKPPLIAYFKRMRGQGQDMPPRPPIMEYFWTFLASFISVSIISVMHILTPDELVMVLASFGASAILIHGGPKSPYGQPRNLILGQTLSAFVGVVINKIVHEWACGEDCLWLASALAVCCAYVVMQMFSCLFPPACATAWIPIIGDANIKDSGFMYIIFPTFTGSVIILVVALIIHNLVPGRVYPLTWGLGRWF